MNRALGVSVIAIAAIYLIVSLSDFLPKYSTVPELVDNQKQLGLTTSTTNLRFHMGLEMVVDGIVVALLVVLGWWLTTTETQQYAYLIALGVVIIALVVLWNMPLVPFNIARISPQGAFYYAQVELEVAGDNTGAWVIIPERQGQRLGLTEVYQDPKLIGKKEVVLEFGDNRTALDAYVRARPPVRILGRMNGTRNLAIEKYIYTVPAVKVLEVGGTRR